MRTDDDLRTAWSRVSPRGLRSLIDYEGCALWLARRLKDTDASEELASRLALHVLLTARAIIRRNLRAAAERDAVVGILNELGVRHVLLKGAARQLLADRYRHADARIVGDVDVLVPETDAPRVWEQLRASGYRCAPNSERYRGHFHLPPLTGTRGIAVEVHVSTSERVSAREAWQRQANFAVRLRCGDGATLVPNATELLWHAVSHAPIRWPESFRVRFFQDAAVVWAAAHDIDWDVIATRLRSDELEFPERARTWLAAAGWLSGRPESADALTPLPTFDLARMLDWRLAVFRSLGREGIGPSGVWAANLRSRTTRLLVAEGTRSAVGMSLGPGRYRPGTLSRAGRWIAAAAARLCYLVWCLGRGGIGRRAHGATRQRSAALGASAGELSARVGW